MAPIATVCNSETKMKKIEEKKTTAAAIITAESPTNVSNNGECVKCDHKLIILYYTSVWLLANILEFGIVHSLCKFLRRFITNASIERASDYQMRANIFDYDKTYVFYCFVFYSGECVEMGEIMPEIKCKKDKKCSSNGNSDRCVIRKCIYSARMTHEARRLILFAPSGH